MKQKPIEFFKDNDEFQECAKYWKHKLFLDNWFIKFELIDGVLRLNEESKEEELFGLCNKIWENHEALIQISHSKNMQSYCTKNIEELTLIHELLHCVIFPIEGNSERSTYANVYLDLTHHETLEQLAKTLLMAKYNLDYDYFIA